jgi:hypothetical protein
MDMATRSKTAKSTKQDSGSTSADQKPKTIQKGVYLSALVYVKGEQPPAENFTALATSALKDALASALKGDHGGLSMTLKKVEVQNDVEQDDGQSAKGEKFQF